MLRKVKGADSKRHEAKQRFKQSKQDRPTPESMSLVELRQEVVAIREILETLLD